MLDWQNKKWIKVIACVLVITFLAYDIAWATDFSPIALHSAIPGTPGIFPKITSFISEKIFKKTDKTKKPEETEISFRSQLVPSKKYEERSGFLRLEAVRDMIKRQMDEMQRRQQIEQERVNRYIIDSDINKGLYIDAVEKAQEAQSINQQIMKARGETMGAAAATSEFNYVMNKDGSKVNYIDGLPSSIENEQMADSYGYVSIKNTKNMKYNSSRLLTSYDAEVIDPKGNITKINWYDAVYSPDSVWWADSTTKAGKYMLSYKEIITDPQGTVIQREWSTAKENYDSLKRPMTYRETIKDAIGNTISTSDWSNGIYDGDKLKSYHQVTKDAYGNVSTLDWEAEYNNFGYIKKSSSKEKLEKRDHSTSFTESATTYDYDSNGTLNTASGTSAITGEDEYGNRNTGTTTQHYETINGQVKLTKNLSIVDYENIDGSTAHSESVVEYTYDSRNLLIGAEGITGTTGKNIFGNGYKTITTDTYEIIASQARRVHSVSISDEEDLFGSNTHSETINDYKYDAKTGDLISATGYTDTLSEDLFGNQSVTRTDHIYQIINGEARMIGSETRGDLVNPGSEMGQIISGIQDFLESYAALATPEAKQAKLQEAGLAGLGLKLADLTTAGALKIAVWLFRASTNLINCAINAVYNILSKLGITVTKKELIQKAVLIDVLSGVITPENASGDLMLSMYSMVKAAQAKGITLYGANVTIEQLKSIGKPVIAHVGGDHYIVIKSVGDSQITYIQDNEEKIMGLAEFLSVWEGNIATQDVPSGVTAMNEEALKAITGAEAQYRLPRPKKPTDPATGVNPPQWSAPEDSVKPKDAKSSQWEDVSGWEWQCEWNDSEDQWEWKSVYVEKAKISWQKDGKNYYQIFGKNRENKWEAITNTEGKPTGPAYNSDYNNSRPPDGRAFRPPPLDEKREMKVKIKDGIYVTFRYSKSVPVIDIEGKVAYFTYYLVFTDPVTNNDQEVEWVDSSSWEWEKIDGEWMSVWKERAMISWAQSNGPDKEENRYSKTFEENSDASGWVISEGTNGFGGFLKEIIEVKGDPNGRHVAQWSDDGQSGFELFRKGEPNTGSYYLYYLTWNYKDGKREESLTIIEGFNIYMKSQNDKGTTVTEAERNQNASGVNWANIWNNNTETKSVMLAKIKREGNYYHIDGESVMYEGLLTVIVSLKREIGKDEAGVLDRKAYFIRNDSFVDWPELVKQLKDNISAKFVYDELGMGLFAKVVLSRKTGGDGDFKFTIDLDELWEYPEKEGDEFIFKFIQNGTSKTYTAGSMTLDYTTGYIVRDEDGNIVEDHTSIDREIADIKAVVTITWVDEEGKPVKAGESPRGYKIRVTIQSPSIEQGFDPSEPDENGNVTETINHKIVYNETSFEFTIDIDVENMSSGTDLSMDAGKLYQEFLKDKTDEYNKQNNESLTVEQWLDKNPLYKNPALRAVFDQKIKLIKGKNAGEWIPEITRTYKDGATTIGTMKLTTMKLHTLSKELNDLKSTATYKENLAFMPESLLIKDMKIATNGVLDYTYEISSDGVISGAELLPNNTTPAIDTNPPEPLVRTTEPSAAGALGVFSPLGLSSLLRGQTVISFDSGNNVESIVMPDRSGNIVKYTLKSVVSENKFRMKSGSLNIPDIILTLDKEGNIAIEAVDSGNPPILIQLADGKAIGQARGAETEGVYEISQDISGNKIMLIDFQAKELKEEKSIKTATSIIEAIKKFLEEKMQAIGAVPDKIRNAINTLGGVTKFLKWLTQMGTYLINCAVIAAKAVLAKAGVNLGVQEIAVDMILLDLMAGNINPRTTAILYSTFSAIEKIIKNNGVNMKTMYFTRSQLENITTPVIAHVGGDHAVVVTGVYNGEVYIIESDGKLYNVPINKFLEEWSGFMIAERAPPMTGAPDTAISIPEQIPSQGFIATPQEKLIPQAIEDRLKKASEIPSSDQKIILVTKLKEPEADLFDHSRVHESSPDVITTIGIDGSITYTKSWVKYEYDADGRLISASGEDYVWGEDIFGNSYRTTSTSTYLIIGGQAKKVRSESITESETLDGSNSATTGTVNYEYTDGTEDPSTLPSAYTDEDGNVLKGLLKHADGSSVTTGSDVFGNGYTTRSTDTYAIINGEARVQKSVSNTESQTISGALNKTTSTIEYLYADGTEDPDSLPAECINEDGKIIVGSLKGANGLVQSSSEDVFGNAYTTTTIDTYGILAGRAKVLQSNSITKSVSLDGLINTNTGRIEYEYSVTEDPYVNPETGRSGIGVLVGAKGGNIVEGEDVFGNKYFTTTTNTYTMSMSGQAKVLEAVSLTESVNIDGSIRRDENFITYHYTDGTEDPATLGPEYFDKDGNIIIGILKSAEGHGQTTGEDAFGNRYTTVSANRYIYRKGEVFVEGVDSVTTGRDLFGNSYTTTTWMDYSFGSLKKGEKGALRDADFVISGIGAKGGGSVTVGRDLFGAEYNTAVTNTYIFNKGQLYVNKVDSLTKGSDAFGSSYTSIGFVEYLYSSLKKGEKGALRDADFILIDARGGNENTSIDVFGSNSITTTTNTYIYNKGQVYVLVSDSVTTGSDLFGYSYATTGSINYSYGQLLKGENGALRNAEFAIKEAAGGSSNVTHNVFGELTTSVTTNIYKIVKGQSLIDTSVVVTSGTNLFGESYVTTTITKYTYHETPEGPNKAYGELKDAITESNTEGSDVWGSSYATISTSYYTNINNRALVSKVMAQTTGENLFGESYTTESITEYFYYDGKTGPDKVYGEIRDARSVNITTGLDVWGSSYQTTSTTKFIIIKNKPLQQEVTAVTAGSNLFGESYTTYSTTTYTYKDTEGGDAKETSLGQLASTASNSVTNGTDVWGATYTTTSETKFTQINNRPFAEKVTAVTTGTNLFGESYTTYSTTTYAYNDKGEILST
ncbi:MAG: cysteine peptidase family C39 domain-containing protein, partial [Candidatus Omnitrophota bacterium]|nr:cysteine peptidase family C39 domain-containing protein [Candidatus Omnitrophota bacterium]